jgi:peptidoglycan/LPS O-acetylase OafA/YrhL
MSLQRVERPIDFIIARFSRLYPNYWTAVIISTIALSLSPLPDTAPGLTSRIAKAAVNMTMFQRWLRVESIDPVYWTLQVEMSFYLIMLVLIWTKSVDKAIPVFVGLTCLAIADHLLLPKGALPALDRLRGALILPYVNTFLAGMCIYKIRKENHWAYWIALLLCPIAAASHGTMPGGLTEAACVAGFSALVLAATTGWLPVLDNPVLQFLGTISYSLYLIHFTVGRIAIHRLTEVGTDAESAVALALALSLAMATVMTFAIEQPALRYMRNLRSTKSRTRDEGMSANLA